MARTRLDLHEELCKVLESRNCYYEAPSQMKYPCIKYEMQNPSIDYADNEEYRFMNMWMLTIIDTDPDSEIPAKLKAHFKHYCSRNREYDADGLKHFVYTLYY